MKDKIKIKVKEYLKRLIRQVLNDEYINSPHIFGDPSRLIVAKTAIVNNAFFNCNSGTIIIEDHVGIAHNAMILTGSHNFNVFEKERETAISINRDIKIKKGAFIGSGSIIIGPCTIGEHAVVGAGAVVRENVPNYAIVTGNPSQIVKFIENDQKGN
ncbi:acyltransferase [Mucilaginibacter sp. McL0603]|uniref:acyltransferase n=1 Tax=Mucilaginibacter sp. McL0603 TaxID=3415670 RepID=UPI003CF45F38